jgi:hypothetical protein
MNTDEVIKKKRGRKPKNIVPTENVVPMENVLSTENVVPMENVLSTENIVPMENVLSTENIVPMENVLSTEHVVLPENIAPEEEDSQEDEQQVKIPKKRGRKPKGGKIITNTELELAHIVLEPNIILHLKCKFTDIEASSLTYDCKDVDAFQFEKTKGPELGYHLIDNTNTDPLDTINSSSSTSASTNEAEFKNICNKIKNMSYNLQNNNISDKKSDCFWCTCSFDNPPIYIPKHKINNTYQCYGCFCSPECATAFLFKEAIDTSTRFERYYLLNHIYNKVFNYTKNIKPAPDPFYTLNKYYGSLTIQEYRRLFKSERLLIVVDKPLSRVLPELHEYNDDILFNDNLQNTGKFKIKRKTKQNKTDILNETFNKQ